MKSTKLHRIFLGVLCLVLLRCPAVAAPLTPERLSTILSVIGNDGPATSQVELQSENPNFIEVQVGTPSALIRITFDRLTGSITTLSQAGEPLRETSLKWSISEVAIKADTYKNKLTNTKSTFPPDRIAQQKTSSGGATWSVSWYRRIGEFIIVADFISLRFDEGGNLYSFIERKTVPEDTVIPLSLISREEGVESAKKHALRVMGANSSRFRGYKIGDVESAEKALFTPVKGYDAASIMLHKHDPKRVRTTWMVLFNNVRDSDYAGEGLAVPESKLMIWVDAETGDYCGANF